MPESGGLQRLAAGCPRWLLLALLLTQSLLLNQQFGRQSDSSPAYLGCLLLARGQGDALYAHDPASFAKVQSETWTRLAIEQGLPFRRIHPYVQSPLYADLLRPLCTRITLKDFDRLMTVVSSLALFALLTGISRRSLAPDRQRAGLVLMTLLSLVSMPWLYHVELGQNHAVTLLLCWLALTSEHAGRWLRAGLLLALAILMKTFPMLLLAWWGWQRRWRPMLATLLGGALLLALTWQISGTALLKAYLDNLQRIGGTLVLAFNNNALVTWFPDALAISARDLNFTAHAMPGHYPALAALAALLLTGLATRLAKREAGLGMLAALVTMTVCTPLAWIHYFLFLAPISVLLLLRGDLLCRGLGLAIILLGLLRPAWAPLHEISAPWLVRPELTASLLALLGLFRLPARRRAHD